MSSKTVGIERDLPSWKETTRPKLAYSNALGKVPLHTYVENNSKGVALILFDFKVGSLHSCEIECTVYNCMEQQVENRSWDPKTPVPLTSIKRKVTSEGYSRKNARFLKSRGNPPWPSAKPNIHC